jgi:protein-tyrosine phosphatase
MSAWNDTDESVIEAQRILCSNFATACNVARLKKLGVKYVIGISRQTKSIATQQGYAKEGIQWTHHLLDDASDKRFLTVAEAVSKEIEVQYKQQQLVLIHCDQGRSRSPAILIYYYLTRRNHSLSAATGAVGMRRAMEPNAYFQEQLVYTWNQNRGHQQTSAHTIVRSLPATESKEPPTVVADEAVSISSAPLTEHAADCQCDSCQYASSLM